MCAGNVSHQFIWHRRMHCSGIVLTFTQTWHWFGQTWRQRVGQAQRGQHRPIQMRNNQANRVPSTEFTSYVADSIAFGMSIVSIEF